MGGRRRSHASSLGALLGHGPKTPAGDWVSPSVKKKERKACFAEFKTTLNKGSEEANQDAKEAKEEKNNQTIFKEILLKVRLHKDFYNKTSTCNRRRSHDYYDFVAHFLSAISQFLL